MIDYFLPICIFCFVLVVAVIDVVVVVVVVVERIKLPTIFIICFCCVYVVIL